MVFKHDRLERGLSVVICCYNSATRIGTTLKYLAEQKNIDFPVEIILVNNASTDSTVETAQKEWHSLRALSSVTIVEEPLPGLMNARIAGIVAAKYTYIVFCDDDNHLFDNYLSCVFNHFESYPNIGAIGGEGIVTSDIEIPDWFSYFSNFYACFPQKNAKVLYGAGMSVRTDILRFILMHSQSFHLIGRSSGGLAGGDDHELCYLIKATGVGISYVPSLRFYHYMPPVRLTEMYLRKILYGSGLSAPLLWAYESRALYLTILFRIVRLFLGFPKRLIAGGGGWRLLVLRMRMHAFFTVGVVRGVLKNLTLIRSIHAGLPAKRLLLSKYKKMFTNIECVFVGGNCDSGKHQ